MRCEDSEVFEKQETRRDFDDEHIRKKRLCDSWSKERLKAKDPVAENEICDKVSMQDNVKLHHN